MKFADVTNDIAFRKIFGNENRQDSLISFLNAILEFEGNQRIVSATILNPYQLPKLSGGKVTIVDVKASDQKGRQYIVEMQVVEKAGFAKRVLYYISKSYTDQISRGEFYRKLRPAIFIGILEFKHGANPHFISRHQIRDVDTGEQTIKDLEFNFIELPKFNLKEAELRTLTEKWVFFLKNAENLDVVPESVDDEGLRIAYEEANQFTWTKQELDAYNYVSMREEDARAELDFALEKATKLVMEKAKAEMERTVKAEMEKAKAEMEKVKAEMERTVKAKEKEAILELYENDVPIPIIAKSLKTSEEEIRAIIEEFGGK